MAGALKDYDRVKHEFVPFFLNYLRDQTSCLLEGCRSTNQSPAKTPASFRKHKNSNAPLKTFHSTPVSGNSGSAASRSLMFSRGQIEGLPPVPRSRGTSTTDSSVFSDSSCGFKTPDTSRDKSSSFNRSTGGKSSVDSGHRRHRKTPDRSGSARQSWTNMFPSPSSFTIGDFLVSPTPGSGSKKSSRKKEQRERFNASAQVGATVHTYTYLEWKGKMWNFWNVWVWVLLSKTRALVVAEQVLLVQPGQSRGVPQSRITCLCWLAQQVSWFVVLDRSCSQSASKLAGHCQSYSTSFCGSRGCFCPDHYRTEKGQDLVSGFELTLCHFQCTIDHTFQTHRTHTCQRRFVDRRVSCCQHYCL